MRKFDRVVFAALTEIAPRCNGDGYNAGCEYLYSSDIAVSDLRSKLCSEKYRTMIICSTAGEYNF